MEIVLGIIIGLLVFRLGFKFGKAYGLVKIFQMFFPNHQPTKNDLNEFTLYLLEAAKRFQEEEEEIEEET